MDESQKYDVEQMKLDISISSFQGKPVCDFTLEVRALGVWCVGWGNNWRDTKGLNDLLIMCFFL